MKLKLVFLLILGLSFLNAKPVDKSITLGIFYPWSTNKSKLTSTNFNLSLFQNSVGNVEGASISTIDGLRADYEDGWGLVRASNTTPVLVLRFEADDEAALARITEDFRRVMLQVNPDLSLPF